jgi:hypothetical protein
MQAISELQETHQATQRRLEPESESYKLRLNSLESNLTGLRSHVDDEIGELQDQAEKIISRVDEHRELQEIAETAISSLKVQLGFDPDIALADIVYDTESSALTLKEEFHRSRCATAQTLERLQKQVAMIQTDTPNSMRSPLTRTSSAELDGRSIKHISPSLQSRIKESERTKPPSHAREDSHSSLKSRNGEAKVTVDSPHGWASTGASSQPRNGVAGSARWLTSSVNHHRDGQPPLKKVNGSAEDLSKPRGEPSPVSPATRGLRIKGAAEQKTGLLPREEGPSMLRSAYSDDSDGSLPSI